MAEQRIQIIKDNYQLRYLGVRLWSVWDVEKEKNGNYYIIHPSHLKPILIKPDECIILTTNTK